MNKITISILLVNTLIFSTACQNNPNGGRDIGIVVGSILGGVAGAQIGDGSIFAGAAIGGTLGGIGGSELQRRKEALEAAELQRQYEYEQETLKHVHDLKSILEKRVVAKKVI